MKFSTDSPSTARTVCSQSAKIRSCVSRTCGAGEPGRRRVGREDAGDLVESVVLQERLEPRQRPVHPGEHRQVEEEGVEAAEAERGQLLDVAVHVGAVERRRLRPLRRLGHPVVHVRPFRPGHHDSRFCEKAASKAAAGASNSFDRHERERRRGADEPVHAGVLPFDRDRPGVADRVQRPEARSHGTSPCPVETKSQPRRRSAQARCDPSRPLRPLPTLSFTSLQSTW